MSREGQRAHYNQASDVYDSGEQKGVGAAGSVATQKIAGTPGEHGSYAICGGRKLRSGGHEHRA